MRVGQENEIAAFSLSLGGAGLGHAWQALFSKHSKSCTGKAFRDDGMQANFTERIEAADGLLGVESRFGITDRFDCDAMKLGKAPHARMIAAFGTFVASGAPTTRLGCS